MDSKFFIDLFSKLSFWIITSVIATIGGYIYLRAVTNFISFRRLIKFLRIIPRLYRNGINNFFSSRDEIEDFRKPSKMLDYISISEKTFNYTGINFPIKGKGYDSKHTWTCFENLLKRNVEVTLLVWSINAKEEKIKTIADYLKIEESVLKNNIIESVTFFETLKQEMPQEFAKNLKIKSHDKIIFNSAFIIDYATKNAQTFLDVKLYGIDDKSLAILLNKPSKPKDNEIGSLYNRVTNSFRLIDQNFN